MSHCKQLRIPSHVKIDKRSIDHHVARGVLADMFGGGG